MEPTPVYKSLISVRSRRLRTIGSVLLAAVILMSIYGLLVLMPAARVHYTPLPKGWAARPEVRAQHTPGQIAAILHQEEATRKRLLLRAAFAYGYWSVCALLVVAALFIAWLDLREISRSYLEQRKAIWTEAAVRDVSPRDGPPVS